MKILYVTTIGITMRFFESFIKSQLDIGNQVDIATNENDGKDAIPDCYREWGCQVYHIDTSRLPISLGNIRAINQIKELVKNNQYDIVHCHTPLAALATRIACRKFRKLGMKVFYTAHGFHFYSGAPLKNWLMYFPVEWMCSWWTDVLITINKEDYKRSLNCFHAKKSIYVPGVGINTEKFKRTNFKNDNFRIRKREELGVPIDCFLITSVGELSLNKNHAIIIKAIAELNDNSVHYIIVGKGPYELSLKKLIEKLDLKGQIHLLGYREDVAELYACSDVCAFPSIREGQGLAAIEGMAAGLPLICSNNRGLKGIVTEKNALVCHYNNKIEFCTAIAKLKNNQDLCKTLGDNNYKLSKFFDLSIINKQMGELYNKFG